MRAWWLGGLEACRQEALHDDPLQDLEAWWHEGLVALRLGGMEAWRLTLAFCVQTRVIAMINVFSRHRV